MTLILKMLFIDVHIDDKYSEKNFCLSRDLNFRSPVLRTGFLTIISPRHVTYTNAETNLSLIHISILDSQNVILGYIKILTREQPTSGYFVWIYFIY